MKKAKSIKKGKLIDGLNVMAEEEQFNYKKAIIEENKRFGGKDYKARQKKVVAEIMEDLKNNEEGGTNQMKSNKGGVKTKVANLRKLLKVVPPKLDMAKQEQKAISLLNELKSSVNCNNIKLEFSSRTKSGYCSYKAGRRMVYAIKFNSHGSILPVFNITEKEYKKLGGKGKFGDWWTADFGYKDGDDIKSFAKFAEVSLTKLRKPVGKPKPKVTKVVAKKAVKHIVKTI